MKKYTLIIMALVFLASCGSSEVVREARKTVNGEWTLTDVSYRESAEVEIQLMDVSSAECFTRSDWSFISNNNTGSYILEGPNCDSSTWFFIWSIEEGAMEGQYDLLIKPTDSDYKSTTGNTGFRFNLMNLSQNEMTWEQTINFEGDPFTIKLNFNKI